MTIGTLRRPTSPGAESSAGASTAATPPQGGKGAAGPASPAATVEPRPLSRVSVRSRIVASVLAMSLLGMLVTGGVAFLVQDRLLSAGVSTALEQEVAEFRTLASEDVDPETGQPFASVQRLLEQGLQRNVPDRNETFLTLLDGVPLQFDGSDRPIRLEDEPAVLDAVAQVGADSGVVVREVATSAGRARLAIVPVSSADQGQLGHLVVAFAVDQEREDLLRLARIYLAVSLGSLLLVGLVAWLVGGRLLRPLRLLRESTTRISETDLTERIPVRGNDDVTDLTRTYNAMLDRLEAAFDAQRRFLDDAGHELRTPLTIVRGHLELLDAGDPADVAETRALVIDEIDRMARLVEDLVLLSKAERPDFLVLDGVELGALTDDILDKVSALGERRWALEARGDGQLVGDAQRLTQAWVELANNALKFSEPGSTVWVGSRVEPPNARLWVRDEGVGMDPADVEHAFARFGRLSSGRGVDGSGLGLSIVAAIAEAHHGRVEVDSTPGHGCRVSIVVPLSFAWTHLPEEHGEPDTEEVGLAGLLEHSTTEERR